MTDASEKMPSQQKKPEPEVSDAAAVDKAAVNAEGDTDQDAGNGAPQPPKPLTEAELKTARGLLEALLFSSEEPLSPSRIRDVAPFFAGFNFQKAVKQLNAEYEKSGRSFRIKSIAGGYQLFTLPEYDEYLQKFYARRSQNRLTTKALETLAIIAYKQPITRVEIEDIRGVNTDGVMRTLLSRNLVAISGAAPTPGNPFLYKTTRAFLEYFGLKGIKDLPRLKELDEIVETDVEIKEKFGEAFLKDIAPEILGLKQNGAGNADEADTEATAADDDSDSPKKSAKAKVKSEDADEAPAAAPEKDQKQNENTEKQSYESTDGKTEKDDPQEADKS